MNSLLLLVHVIIAFLIIGLVLIQHGKGAEVGAAFGSGASNTIFGSQGSGSFLAKATVVLALLFAITSISMTKLSSVSSKSGILDVREIAEEQQLPENSSVKTNKNNSLEEELPGDIPMLDKLKNNNNSN